MRAVYVFLIILVLMLGISSYFLNTVNQSVTGTLSRDTNNKLTGHATGGSQTNPLNPVLVVSGDVNSCFVYRVSCPDDTKTLFRVPEGDFGFIG